MQFDKKIYSGNYSDVVVLAQEDGDKAFAVGLNWQVLIGQGSEKKQIAETARSKNMGRKATKYLRYYPPNKVVDEETYGFYKGKPPKNLGKIKKSKIYVLAAIFARVADKESAFIYALGNNNFGFIASRNNHPVYDLINLSESEVIDIARSFKYEQDGKGAMLYYGNEIPEEIIKSIHSEYPVSKTALDEFFIVNDEALLLNIPTEFPIGAVVIGMILAGISYYGYSWYEEYKKKLNLNLINNNVVYERLYQTDRNAKLEETGRFSASEFVRKLRRSELWNENNVKSGWQFINLKCAFNLSNSCVRSWERFNGTSLKLANNINSNIQIESVKLIKDLITIDMDKYLLSSNKLEQDQQMKLKWTSWMQELQNRANRVSYDKVNNIKIEYGEKKLLGQWSGNLNNINSRSIVYFSQWQIEGNLVWFQELENLPEEFLILDLSIERDKNTNDLFFKTNGIVLSK